MTGSPRTCRRANSDTVPRLFDATHRYTPESVRRSSVSCSRPLSFTLSRSSTGRSRSFLSHEIVGLGLPLALQLSTADSPSNTDWSTGRSTILGRAAQTHREQQPTSHRYYTTNHEILHCQQVIAFIHRSTSIHHSGRKYKVQTICMKIRRKYTVSQKNCVNLYLLLVCQV